MTDQLVELLVPDGHEPLEVVDVPDWSRPLPGNDPLAKEYFRLCASGVLTVERCPACGSAQHYPRGICVRCGATPALEAVSGRGRVYAYSVVRQNGVAPFRGLVPYVLALVDLDEGPRLMGNIVDCDPGDVAVGAGVRAFVMRANPEVGIPQWRLDR